MKVGDKIYVKYGYDYSKAKIIAEENGIFLFRLIEFGNIDILGKRPWFPRKSFIDKIFKK